MEFGNDVDRFTFSCGPVVAFHKGGFVLTYTGFLSCPFFILCHDYIV
ncbi:hypothetical protein [Flavobacterium sp. Arc3]